MPGIAFAIAVLPGKYFQPHQMFAQSFAHQCGPVLFCAPRGLIGGAEELLVEDDLDRFHIVEFTP